MRKIRKLPFMLLSFFALPLLFMSILTFVSCKDTPTTPTLSPLKAEGARIVNAEGNEVFLRGVNAGGLFVIEEWMTGFTGCNDHKNTTRALTERFGKENAQAVWKEHQKNWWNEVDFQNCKEMGINAIRLPFTYMNVDFDATFDYLEAGKNYDFTALDEFISAAARYNIYTILDLHGAYGSQNGMDHSGEIIEKKEDVVFYRDQTLQTHTVNLWAMLAEHYRENPNVAGYDILNEPAEKAGVTERRHWEVFDDIYQAIRKEDSNHIVIFESCWEGEHLPHPSEYGWQNCVYSFHHYAGDKITFAEHTASFQNKLRAIDEKQFGLPLQMGEFTCYNDEQKWDWTLNFLNRQNWHWNTWTYKVNNGWNSAWGVYNATYTGGENIDDFKIDARKDSMAQILAKLERVKTVNYHKTAFPSGNTLFDLLRKYCKI